MNQSNERLLRLHQIIGDKKATPPIPPIIPISRSTFLQGVKDGLYPKGLLIGKRTRVWKASEIFSFVDKA